MHSLHLPHSLQPMKQAGALPTPTGACLSAGLTSSASTVGRRRMFLTGNPEESRMLLSELSETALLLLLLLSLACGPTTIAISSDDTKDCLVGVAYGLGRYGDGGTSYAAVSTH